MNTALFLSLFTLFGNPTSPTTTVRRVAIAQPVTQVAVTAPATRVNTPTTRLAAPRLATVRRTAIRPVTVRAARIPVTSTETTREPEGTGSFGCTVLENGAIGSAAYRVLDGSTTVATGRCHTPVASLPAGDYRVEVSLDGMADRVSQTFPLAVRDGRTATVQAVFETSRLTVTVTRNGVRIPGRAVLKKDGRVVASIGSGVYSRVSAGRYEVEISTDYGSIRGSRTVTLDLAPGQVRAVSVPL